MKYFAHSQKEFVYKYVVMLSDIDQFKHMSFANYLKLMFLATDALLLGVKNSADLIATNRLHTYSSSMQFRSQTVFGDNILIKINASLIAQARFSLLYTYILEESGRLVALGRQELGFVDPRNIQMELPVPTSAHDILSVIAVNEDNLLYKF